jgi:hypothetical protein
MLIRAPVREVFDSVGDARRIWGVAEIHGRDLDEQQVRAARPSTAA